MTFIKPAFLLLMCVTAVFGQSTEETTTNITTTLSPLDILREIRRNQTTKDADLIIKMTRDFITDMGQKMQIIRRMEKIYDQSADFTTGTVYSDIQKKFKHMCDLYSNFATVRRYVLGHRLNKTMQPNPDVVVIYQFMLSDYNEIGMMMELYKVEQLQWREGVLMEKSRHLLSKQMEKFGNVPSNLLPPIVEDKGKEDMGKEKAAEEKKPSRRWKSADYPLLPRKWSGEFDGVGFDDR